MNSSNMAGEMPTVSWLSAKPHRSQVRTWPAKSGWGSSFVQPKPPEPTYVPLLFRLSRPRASRLSRTLRVPSRKSVMRSWMRSGVSTRSYMIWFKPRSPARVQVMPTVHHQAVRSRTVSSPSKSSWASASNWAVALSSTSIAG